MRSSVVKDQFRRSMGAESGTTFQRSLQVTPELIARLGLQHELQGHSGCVNCIEWNEKGTLLASGSDDVQVILWDPFRCKQLTTIRTGHQGNIFSVKFMPSSEDNILVTCAADCKIRVHDLKVRETTHVFGCHAGRVKRIATAPNVPFMFWSAAEDGTIMQFDLRCPENSQNQPKNVLINLNAHIGNQAEAKCISINPVRPELLAVGANDPYVRIYDRRHLTCKGIKFPTEYGNRSPWERINLLTTKFSNPEDFELPDNGVQYYIAGHLPQKQQDYKKRYRTLASTYVNFSPDGSELLVNLGGEQIYLFDVNKRRKMRKFDLSLILASNGIIKEAASAPPTNGFSLHKNGTNGVTHHQLLQGATSISAEIDERQAIATNSHKRYKVEQKPLPPEVDVIKKRANAYFEKEQYTKAIILYNEAISRVNNSAVLYGNRAATYMKRRWDGDLYAALRDCHNALQKDPNHLKAHFRLARCLYELSWPQEAHDCLQQFQTKFPDYAKSHACEALDQDIKAAIYSKTEEEEKDEKAAEAESSVTRDRGNSQISDQEKVWRSQPCDYEYRFCGHCNTTTDIKEANFFGSNGQYIVAGSDDGSFFIWEKSTTNIVRVLKGDDSIVNCLQPHPSSCLLATSGIDQVVRLWSPRPEDGTKNEREVDNSDDAATANQKRMNADPLEVMLLNMGYRITGLSGEDEDADQSDTQDNCRPS